MISIAEVSRKRGNEIKNINALNASMIASLEKMEQSLLNLSRNIANMNKRYDAAMKPRECERILDNIVSAQ